MKDQSIMSAIKQNSLAFSTLFYLVVNSIRPAHGLALGPVTSIPIISPSVAKADFLKLGFELRGAVDGGAKWLHFSVQDGKMVPKISFGPPIIAACREEFPETIFDVKLGIVEPEKHVANFAKAGANIISVHPESTLQLGAVIHMIEKNGCAPGVVLNPATPVSAVEHVLGSCRVAVVMLVNPGYGGPKYINVALKKIAELRALCPDLHISVDGGVNGENAAEFVDAGANVLVAGGSVFKAEDKSEVIRQLQGQAAFVRDSAVNNVMNKAVKTPP